MRDAVRLAQVLNEMHDDQWGRALCRGIQGGLIGDDCVFSYGFTNESFNEGGGGQEFSEWSWLEGSEGWCGGRDRLLGARDSFSIRGL